MENKSFVVVESGKSKHKSRLVKAVGLLSDNTLTPANKMGVWGITATIKFNTGVTLKSSDIDFEFELPFEDNLDDQEGEIIVFNLSDATIKQLKANTPFTVVAGHKGDTGLIYSGLISKVSTRYEGADKVTTIKVKNKIARVSVSEKTYTSGTFASTILKELLDKYGVAIAKISNPMPRDHEYENDVTIGRQLRDDIKTYSEVCGVSAFISNGKIYCCPLKEANNNDVMFDISEETGMINSPVPFEEVDTVEKHNDTTRGFDIDMILQHRMSTGTRVKLKSKQYSGTYYVKSGVHRFNPSEATTEIKVVE